MTVPRSYAEALRLLDAAMRPHAGSIPESLRSRMLAAADTLEEVAALFGYPDPVHATWSPAELRAEARHLGD